MLFNSLQLDLAVVGGLVLTAMVAHGAWASRKNRPKQASPDAVDTDVQREGGIEPKLEHEDFVLSNFSLSMAEKKPSIDALIDVIAPMTLEAPIAGEVALAAMPSTRRAGGKPFAIEGFNQVSQRWEMPQAGQRYTQFQAGVQLANRSGPLNEIEYSEFVVKIQAFCEAINGSADFPEMREEVARARELDHFASDHDAQLGFMLRARQAAWSPGYVAQNAERCGFVAGAIAGRMALPASVAGLPPVLTLNFDAQAALADDPALSAIRALTISLDVAQVDRGERAFVRLREALVSMAASMDGVVTDDNGLLLPTEAMDVIGAELEHLYNTLDQRDLSAGSALARRLFS